MNNTKTLTAIVAILIAATLVVGGTLATSTTHSICLSTKEREDRQENK